MTMNYANPSRIFTKATGSRFPFNAEAEKTVAQECLAYFKAQTLVEQNSQILREAKALVAFGIKHGLCAYPLTATVEGLR